MLTIGNKAEEIWGQWVGIQKIATVGHLAKPQLPRWACSAPAGRGGCKGWRGDSLSSKAGFLSPLHPSPGCVDQQGVSPSATELPSGTTGGLKSINTFCFLILLFCAAQLPILHSRPHKVSSLSALLCLRSACSLLLEQCRNEHLIVPIPLCPEVAAHKSAGITIAATIC